ncbi:PstS family phosphate ABC transporter substrate-binding protein [Parafilimonas sp.]|uniref:PstS family phosphate ABC transporter substrate-binding protein n=1 Tax=Parafilimonas sp. TaxID=1969739 RepID=UPI003F7EA15E
MFKQISTAVLLFSVFIAGCSGSAEKEKSTSGSGNVSISFSGAFALYPLVQTWVTEYNKIHPEIRFDVQAGGAGKGLTDCLAGAVDVGMFSRELSDAEKEKGVWSLSVCKDAVLPTMNVKNPFYNEVQARGVKKEEFNAIFVDNSIKTWQQLLGKGAGADNINVYTRADAAGAADSWAAFFGKKQENLKGIGVNADPGVADAVRKDIKGIGYNNTLFVFDQKTGNKLPGIDVVPIDVNGNGKIDTAENFYGNLNSFLQAVNDGKFPSPPARNLYFLTKGKTQKKELLDFFKWVLTDGQKFVHVAGYVPLPENILTEQAQKL